MFLYQAFWQVYFSQKKCILDKVGVAMVTDHNIFKSIILAKDKFNIIGRRKITHFEDEAKNGSYRP